MACYRADRDAIVLAVRLTPRAAHDAVDGTGRLADGTAVALARVTAVPEAGRANAALTKLLAGLFHVPKSAVSVVAGNKARVKQVRIAGDPETLARVIETWPERD